MTQYRGWTISAGRWPEPAYTATSPNYDASYEGEEDGWVDNGEIVHADTHQGIIAAIDDFLEERADLPPPPQVEEIG